MKRISFFLFLLFANLNLFGQDKALIDTQMLDTWPKISTVENIQISPNGHYAAYIIERSPVNASTLFLHDLVNNRKKSLVSKSIKPLFFSADSRKFCWKQGDSLWLENTGIGSKRLLGVNKLLSYPEGGKVEWIALVGDNKDSVLQLINVVTGKEQTFISIKKHSWSADGRFLILTTTNGEIRVLDLLANKSKSFTSVKDYILAPGNKGIMLTTEEAGGRVSLRWAEIKGNKSFVIWTGLHGEQPRNYIYDSIGEQFAFNVQGADGVAIWYYRIGQPSGVLKVSDKNPGIKKGLKVSGVSYFSVNRRWLFFKVKQQIQLLPIQLVHSPVDIWSYRDVTINPAQPKAFKEQIDQLAVIGVGDSVMQLIQKRDDEKVSQKFGDYVIIVKGGDAIGNSVSSWWPHNDLATIWLMSLKDGKRSLLKRSKSSYEPHSPSPEGRWIIYWDQELGHYFSLDPNTMRRVNLTTNLPVSVFDENMQYVEEYPVGLAGWYAGDSAIMVYDNYDIWKIDPSGRKAAVNLTGGYGMKHKIKLRLVYEDYKGSYNGNEELLLTGLNVETQHNGFFKMSLNNPGAIKQCTMGPYTYCQVGSQQGHGYTFSNGLQPIEGGMGKSKRWVVMRQSATNYPNLYVTQDFNSFKALTDLQPQKVYNWLSSEIVSWKMYNGHQSLGTLYKPENFDPNKKYPIIFNYYEKLSHECYQFIMPGLTRSNIDIPWFVSRGYLVFTPDIQYSVASKPGGMTVSEAAYNAVASAAEYLSKRPYIDKDHMAIQGQSFGGHETNAIITQTNLFAAAAEMAGYSDLISAYLTLVTGTDVKDVIESQHKIDHSNQRMGATPWERPDLYQKNSPVLNADKIKTPLFIVHNKIDGAVNFNQGLEMYMALRRLIKPVWLLQYDNSGHVLGDDKDALDYTVRLTQYFDHYLKGMPAPQWMTMNTLAGYKGKNNLYDLDPKGNCGKDCKVCKEWNAKSANHVAISEENKDK